MRNYFTTCVKCCVPPERVDITTPPGNPAVELSFVKAHLNIAVAITQFDVLLEKYISVATIKVECFTGHTLIETVFKGFYNCFPECMLIKATPNADVTEIKYIDIDGNEQALDSTEYNVFKDKFEAKVLPEDCWPCTKNNTPDAVTVAFKAGYGAETEDVPDDFQLAIAQIVAFMFANKGDCPEECVSSACLGVASISCRQDLRALGGCK